MKHFSRIALALLLTVASAFAEEVIPMDAAGDGTVPDLQQAESPVVPLIAEGTAVETGDSLSEESPAGVELASTEAASSSENVSVTPAPWTDTMSSLRTGGSPEGARNPNELQAINWSDEKTLLIGAGVLLFIILLIVIAD
jgi:hypothetical protein